MSSAAAHPSLLLLPSPPQPPSRAALSAAYRGPLTDAITKLKSSSPSPNAPSHLTIALTCPFLAGSPHNPRSRTLRWKKAQALLAGLYTLIAVVCAEQGVASHAGAVGPGAVDARVVLVDHERGRRYEKDFEGRYSAGLNCTTILDLAAFATMCGPWGMIMHPSSEAGYELLNLFLGFIEGKQTLQQNQIVALQGGLSLSTEAAEQDRPGGAEESVEGYETAVLGGTFDHLHPGHKLLLHATVLLLKVPAATSSEMCNLVVGISGDGLLKNKKYASELESWQERAMSVLSFLSTVLNFSSSPSPPQTTTTTESDGGSREIVALYRNNKIRVRCVDIQDPFGPTITEEALGAIAVSGETRGGGAAINERRAEKGWHALDVFEVDVLDAAEEDEGEVDGVKKEAFSAKISSTVIRQQIAGQQNSR